MPTIPTLEEMLKAGVHFGHRTSRWHPKMEPYIFAARSGMHIIDLEKTQTSLESTLGFVKGVAARGGTILFIGTKEQSKDIVKELALECNMPYVTERWLGGTLTNFGQIKTIIKRFKTLREQREKGELRKYTKKEQLLLDREIVEMEIKIGGIQNMTKTPDAVFIADVKTEKTAVEEAVSTNTKVIAICDSNINPASVDHVIPANDDAVKSIKMITRLVAEAVNEGRAEATAQTNQPKTKKDNE